MYLLSNKKQCTYEMINKANVEIIKKLYAEYK